MYKLLFTLFFRRVPAETAHRVGFGLIRAVGALPGRRRIVPPGSRDPRIRIRALGLDLPGPLGLAAGFDKDGRGTGALGSLGFAFVEIGTVTARAQPGNQVPRLFRLVGDRALVNRMGFNNVGAAAVAERLRRDRPGVLVGVNIGRSRVVGATDAVADYVHSATTLAGVADYLVVNVSSPNTPGLRDLQAVDQLRPLLLAVRAALDGAALDGAAGPRRVPLLVKIAPDLADDDVDAVADLALELGLDGIVATNTTVSRAGLRSSPAEIAAVGAGGLSGAPLKERAVQVLRRLRARVGDDLVLISVGGIETADDAWDRLHAGATLLQAYTGFVYGGPLWPRRIHRELGRRVRRDGLASIGEIRHSAPR